MYNGISIEELGTPVVLLANPGFMRDGQSAASNKGMPVIRILPLNVACKSPVPEDIEAGTTQAIPGIIEALTRTLTDQEKAPKWSPEKSSRIAFKGNYEDINRFFYRSGWTDGLPIVPPTEEAVIEMMTGTDLPQEYVVAKVIPRQGKATIEKIAINAVKEFVLKRSESPKDAFLGGVDKEKFDSRDILSQPPTAVNPNSLLIVVAGGPGTWTGLLKSVGGIQNDFATKKIRLPRDWDKLVKKYRNVVPTYAVY